MSDEWEDGEVLEDGEEREEPTPATAAGSGALHASNDAGLASAAAVEAEIEDGEEGEVEEAPKRKSEAAGPKQWPPLPPGPAPPLPPAQQRASHGQPQPRMSSNGSYGQRSGGQLQHPQLYHQPQRPPPGQHYPSRSGGYASQSQGGNYPSANRSQHSSSQYEQDDRTYSADLVLKYPRQQPRSRVLLDFAAWMESSRSRCRLTVDDVQKLLLNVMEKTAISKGDDGEAGEDAEQVVSEYLLPSLFPDTPLPSQLCIVMLNGVHPAVMQKYRPTLPFFDACTSVPVSLTKREHARRIESPLSELLYKFSKPRVDTR